MQKENEKLIPLRHSAEHVLHMAVQKLYPDIKKVMGPAIETGFYFDFDGESKISSEDFPKIEMEMQKIIDADIKIEEKEVSVEEARKVFKENEYKQEWIDEIEQRGEKVTVYVFGKEGDEFYDIDLCKGPHIKNTGEIKAFKLLSVAGAYWKGDENNKMLQRIYGTAFPSQKELEEYLQALEEAKIRDHRKLGKELDLFCFSELVGPGLPLFTPKGTMLKEKLQEFVEEINRKYGFEKVMTPHLAKIDLYELSGHAKKFSEELFRVSSNRNHDFVMKPVQCPHQTQIYASQIRSYRDLPIRYMESEKQYRAEKPGEVGGLNRVYAITVEDGHSFCTVEQVKEEIKKMVNIVREFYSPLGLWGGGWVSLSVRDYDHPEKYIGEPKDWDECEKILQEVSDEMKLDAKRCEGEAALYGPKLDFMFKDALGRDIQIPTVQIDFATPKRFDLKYVDADGQEKPPVMVHRAILGSYERLLALIIEHFAGAFPAWLSPVQAVVIPISEKQNEYGEKVRDALKEKGIRVELNDRDDTMQAKIRNAQLQKVPYMVIVGDKEIKEEKISVRLRDEKNLGAMSLEEFAEGIGKIVLTKSLSLW